MRKFYEKVLPSQGIYCVTGIKNDIPKNKFAETLDDFLAFIESSKANNENVFFNPSSLDGYSRKNENVQFLRSFFVDLDVGEEKGYPTKDDALAGLNDFISRSGLPEPVIIDSGRGVHAYWIFDADIPVAEWKPYAEKFKAYCLDNDLHIDPVITAHQGRILRCPDTENHKQTPPLPTKILSENIWSYDFAEFKEFLGEIDMSLQAILAAVPKGVDEDTRAVKGLDNFETTFKKIAIRSLDGDGCGQIREAINNPEGIHYDQWTAALSIAIKCDDGDEAIHIISEGHHDYDRERTIQKAAEFEGPRTCKWYGENFPEHCKGCQHAGKITTPLLLGRELKIARQPTTVEGVSESVRHPQSTKALPQALYPFVMGEHGGIYFIPEGKYDPKTGSRTIEQPILISRYDLLPVKRIYGTIDGECLLMHLHLPNDGLREFMLPMKHVYASEKFKEIMSSNGVMIPPKGADALMSYVIKWGDYLITKDVAEIMRTQMGWVSYDHDAFVVGPKEYRRDGSVVNAPTSALCREVVKHLHKAGSYDLWLESARKLNTEGFEIHAFEMLAGFGSVLMNFTSTSGVTIALTGDSGNAKTGALYASLSVWGNPKDLSVVESGATGNGLLGRYLALHNLPFGLDEAGGIDGPTLSKLIHNVSHGKAKIRMQSSVNAEREHEVSASLIMSMTSNASFYDKLTTLKKDPNGEVARLVEFTVRKPKLLVDNPSMGKQIFDAFRYNYGHAGPEFINAFYKYSEDQVRQFLTKWEMMFKKDFGDDTTYRFYENLVAAVLTAGDILHDSGILSLDLNRIYNVVVGEMITIRDKVVRANSVDYEGLIGDFLNKNQNCILAVNNGSVSMEPRGPLMIRAEVDSNLLYISRPEFNKYLAEIQVSQREFLFHMEKSGIEVKQVKKKLGGGWKDATSVVNVMTYVFDTTKFATDLYKEAHIEAGT